MAGKTKNALLVALLVATVIAFFGDVLFGDRVLITSNTYRWLPWAEYATSSAAADTYRTDAARTYLPRRVHLRRSLTSGEFPLWNPYILGGCPFFADPQSQVLYPAGLLLLPADPARAMGYDVALHFILAALGMFLFLGAIRAGRTGRVVGALAYAFSSFFFLRMGHPTFVAAASWLPYIFYAYERSRRAEKSGTLLLMVFLCLGYLAGMPQIFLFGVAALLFYAVLDGAEHLISGDRSGIRRIAWVLLPAGAVALLAVCVQLVPFIEYVRNSYGLGFTFEAMSRDHIWQPVFLLRTLVPDLFGNPVDGTSWIGLVKGPVHPYNSGFMVYCGVGGLAMALASLVFLKRSRHIRALFGLLVLSVGAGTSVMLLKVIYSAFPPAAYSQIDRVSVLACFALAALAGKGLSLAESGGRPGRFYAAVPTVLAAVVAAGFAYFSRAGQGLLSGLADKTVDLAGEIWFMRGGFRLAGWLAEDGTAWFDYEMRLIGYALVFAGLCATWIWLYVSAGRRPRLRTAAAWLLGLTLALDLGIAARRYYVTQPAGCLPETEGIRVLSGAVGERGMWRTAGVGPLEEVLPPNTPQLYGIPVFGGLNALYPEAYTGRLGLATALARKAGNASPVLGPVGDFMGVRYLVTDRPQSSLTSSPVMAAMAGSRDLAAGLGVVEIGGDRRLSLVQEPGGACSLYVRIPECRYLDFGLGLAGPVGDGSGEAQGAQIVIRGRGTDAVSLRSGPLDEAGTSWADFRLDVSHLAGESAALVLRALGGGDSGSGICWSGLDFVIRDCSVSETEEGYVIDTGGAGGTLALRFEGPAGDWPVRVGAAGGPGRYEERLVRLPEPRGAASVFLDAPVRGGRIPVRAGGDMVLAGAALVDTEGAVPGLRPYYDGDMFVYENQAAVPRGVCVERSCFPGFDPTGAPTAAIEIAASLGDLAACGCGRASVRLYEPGRVVVDVTAEEACLLLFQDTWYPGWKAEVDGVDSRLLRTDLGTRAVALERGRHEVVMEYRPGSLKLGLVLSLLGILIGVFYGAKAKKL